MHILLFVLYALPLLWIFIYSLGQLHLILVYFRKRKSRKLQQKAWEQEGYPMVTIQLPVYNELYVVENLLDAVAQLDYPLDRFEVQVLDDSTDTTVKIIAKKIKTIQAQGINIKQIRRKDRQGFKAGALAYGMQQAQGEFIAIFDADFQPQPNFLKACLPYFYHKKIGLVQTRWAHSNENYSLLTRLQAFALDAHFVVEQMGRNMAGHFINFNGTAGIWRKSCIEDAGGWSADTLTEDLDLSYRAQLRGWNFVFVDHIATPSELPIAMNAIKSQQFRWTKGAAECARKNLGRVLKSPQVSLYHKIHACFHLLNSSIFISILLMSIFSMPLLVVLSYHQEYITWMHYLSIFFLSFGIVALHFWAAYQHLKGNTFKNLISFLLFFPLFWALSMGLALHNSFAVLEGYLGYKTPFVRTPKFNIQQNAKSWRKNQYLSRQIPPMTYIELFFSLYFLVGIFLAFYWQSYLLLPLHIALFLGYTAVSVYSIHHLAKS